MRLIKRAVHIDFHTMPGIEDFGANLDPVVIARTLADAHVDHVTVFAKCNIGFAYYPTSVGVPYDGLDFDLLGDTVRECQRRGIAVTAYFNIGLDHEMARLHRDWTVVNVDGQVLYGDRTGNGFRYLCLRTDYRQYMLDMIGEVVDRYPVDGVFLDLLASPPCHGDECLTELRRRGHDPLDKGAVADLALETTVDFVRDVKDLIGEDMFLVPNGLPWERSDGLRTHAEVECLPSGGWGYDFFGARIAYARTLYPQSLYMTGRFNVSWGEYGGLKSEASLRNDCWDAISNGAQTSIGDHMHPRDGLEPLVYERIGNVYRDIRALEPWTECATVVADIAILADARRLTRGHDGAARLFAELKYPFDIVDDRHDFAGYRLLVLPDSIVVDQVLAAKLREFLAAGGSVLSTGTSGLAPDADTFALPEWGIGTDGPDPDDLGYVSGPRGTTTAEHATRFTMPGLLLRPDDSVTTIADHHVPYFQPHWDGFHGYFYNPPKGPSGRPAVAQAGNVVQVCFKVFENYLAEPAPAYSELIMECLARLLPDPVINCVGIPSTARVTLTRQPGRYLLHVKTTHPEPRGERNVVDGYPTLVDAQVRLRATGVTRVHTAPDLVPVPFHLDGDHTVISLPRIDGYQLIVVEQVVEREDGS